MAMPTFDGVLALAVQKLGDFIKKEATFLLQVKDELVSIRDELILMQAFLKDAEQKQHADERILWWTGEIRSIAFKTEDIIDAYYTEIKGGEPSKRKLLTTSFRKVLCIAGETNVYDIGKEIKALKERLSNISRKRTVYGIKSIGNTQEIVNAALQERRLEALRRTTSDADEEQFIGFDNDLNMLKTQLSSSDDKWRRGISILGRGGSGKTFLARKLYHTKKNSFDVHAWVCVSRKWDVKDLLEGIINSLKELTTDDLNKLEKLKVVDTKRYLRKLLADKQYLVVIDDLWDEDAWEYLKSALPDYRNGSRVIITTRNEFVAGLSDPKTYVHKLRRLQDDESWGFFCKNVFSDQNNVCPQHLEKIGKEMVGMLDGLPLALTVLGGILSRDKSYNKWHEVQRSIWKKLKIQSIHISALLDLSFNDLTNELKSCFLYLGIFPEDHKIRSEKLIQLWIAEDLVQQSEGLDLEELAESYLEQLNARSLIQLSTHEYTSDSTYRVDNLLQDLAVTKAKEQEIFHIHEEPVNPSTKPISTRRIVFRSGFEKYMSDHSHPEVHTLSFLNYHSLLDDGNVTKLLALIKTTFKSLRVLDLEGVKIATTESKLKLLEAIGKVVHLRYLGVFEADIDELPQWIGNLEALQALDVFTDNNQSKLLSKDICKLKQLRHLNGDFATKNGDILVPPTTLEDLKNLQFLHNIDISGWLTDEKSHESALNAFSKLCKIRMLSLSFDTNHRLSIDPLCSCRNLIQLELNGRIKILPMELHKSLPQLRYLSLHKAQFEQDPLPMLEKLMNLLVLSLDGFLLKSLIITASGFYGLVSLSIRGFHRDMDLQIVEGALPKLRNIHIDHNLTNFILPERFRDL